MIFLVPVKEKMVRQETVVIYPCETQSSTPQIRTLETEWSADNPSPRGGADEPGGSKDSCQVGLA